ncbi:MAG: 50S ribosomal protein L32e [Thermoproteota archaeon]|nr:MAG: 50S ribosomal protein L32e [Candidatus Korarchaeota archaeon]
MRMDKASLKNLLKLKKKKPRFLNVGRYLHGHGLTSWRRPRGIDNKQRIRKKGQPKVPSIGYKNPEKIRGLHPTGLIPKVVHSISELERIPENVKDRVIIYIGRTVGKRKRSLLIKRAKELGFKIINEGVES